MLDEREGPVPTAELSRSFTRKPPWQRILVLLAGPAFNIIFAILVLWGMLWFKGVIEDVRARRRRRRRSVRRRDAAGLRSGRRDPRRRRRRRSTGQPSRRVFGLLDAISADGAADAHRARQGRRTRARSRSTVRRRRGTPQAHRARGAVHGPGLRFLGAADSAASSAPWSSRAARPRRRACSAGDRIVEIDGKPIADFRDLVGRHQRCASPATRSTVRYRARRRRARRAHRRRQLDDSRRQDGRPSSACSRRRRRQVSRRA